MEGVRSLYLTLQLRVYLAKYFGVKWRKEQGTRNREKGEGIQHTKYKLNPRWGSGCNTYIPWVVTHGYYCLSPIGFDLQLRKEKIAM